MKFSPAAPKKPVREELLSEDGCFTLAIDRSNTDHTQYVIVAEKLEICPGIGIGETVKEAMEHSKASLTKAAAVIQERITQLDAMIAEETQKESAAK